MTQTPSNIVVQTLVGIFVGGAAAYLGSLMITRRMALVGDALGHVALPGMGLALLLGIDVSLGALVFLLGGVLLVWKIGEKTLLSTETLVGIVFVTSLALGFVIVPQPELLESLVGDLSRVSTGAGVSAILLSVFILWVVRRIYPGMILLGISSDLARIEGVNEKYFSLIYLLSVALIVSVGVKITGSLFVGALVIIPPATAWVLSGSLRHYAALSVLVAVVSNLLGLALARISALASGPSIILVSAALFVAALIGKAARAKFGRPRSQRGA